MRDSSESNSSPVDPENVGSASESSYREITADLRERSLQRHERRIADVSDLQDALRLKLLGRLALGLLLLLLVGGWLLFKVVPNTSEETPQSVAVWVQQQQLLLQVAQVQQWLQSGEAESDLPPPRNMEELQAWLDQIKLSPDLQKLDEEPASGEPGFVPFQCAASPIQCLASDVPSASGESRVELGHLVRNANQMLVNDGNCEGPVNLIGEYDSLFGWRRSEAVTKAQIELSVGRCFMDNENPKSAGVHYQRAYCASVSDPDPHQAMNALYGLAKISWLDQNLSELQTHVQCSESLLDYHLQTDQDVNTLNNYITLSLMYYELTGDTRESIRLEEKALDAARAMAPTLEAYEVEDHQELMMILQMNLMEGYLTLGESLPINQIHAELKNNPMLEDGDRLVARGLLVMQDLIDGENQSARNHLNTLINRYKSLSEFTTVWSWSAFDRWQEKTKSNRRKKIDDLVKELRVVLSPDRPADSVQRLYRILASIEAG